MDYKLVPARMPTIRKFAKKIGIHVSNVYKWLDSSCGAYQKDFQDAFTCAKAIRKDWLIDLGLSGLTPPLSFKFVAINVTDMVDRQDVGIEIDKEAKKFSKWLNDRELPMCVLLIVN
jgi:hypothetical protein